MPRRRAVGYAMVSVAATLFAINGTVSKVILGSGIDAEQLTEVRCAGALLGLMLIALATRPAALPLRRSELPLIVALGVVGLALVQWSYFVAIHRVAIGVALVIQFVGPILVALWARFVYHEQVRARLWVDPRRDHRDARAGRRDRGRLGSRSRSTRCKCPAQRLPSPASHSPCPPADL